MRRSDLDRLYPRRATWIKKKWSIPKFRWSVILLGMLFLFAFGVMRYLSKRFGSLPVQSASDDLTGFRPFLPTDPWNNRVEDAPVDPVSDGIIKNIGFDSPIKADFGAGYRIKPFGIPYTIVRTGVPLVSVVFDYESDNVGYPIPPDVKIEEGINSKGDRHIILIDREANKLYELYNAFPSWKGDGTWVAGSGAVFDLRYNTNRPKGWTSADGAGLPIFPGLARYDEVARGEIPHALRFTVKRTRAAYVAPANHKTSKYTDPNLPPMGMRVRLKASVPIDDLPPQARVVAQALKKYGMLLADNGGNWYISGTPDYRWNDSDLKSLRRLKGRDFEVIKLGWTGDTSGENHRVVLKRFFEKGIIIAKKQMALDHGLPLSGQSKQEWLKKMLEYEDDAEFKKVISVIVQKTNGFGNIADAMKDYPQWFDNKIIQHILESENKGDLVKGIEFGVAYYADK